MITPLWDMLFQSTVTAAILAFLVVVAKEWLLGFVKEGIASQFRKEQERYVAELHWQEGRRQKAADIAAVITQWLSLKYDASKRNDVTAVLALQQNYWELALWLDAETLRLLNRALTHEPGADHKSALAAVRSALVGHEASPIEATEFEHWPIPGFPESVSDQYGPPA